MYTVAAPTGPVTCEQSQHHHFTPKTPSPLRTSSNANLMPPPQWSSPSSLDTKSSPLAPYASAHEAFPVRTLRPRRASTASLFPPTTSNNPSDADPWSAFASRSRASTPHATLSAQNAAAKERRKCLFRDKIRRQRDDVRFEGRGDQVLRMDFVRERREWEEKLARKAPADLDGDEGMDATDDPPGAGKLGLVPLTEEEEIEALATHLLDREDDDLRAGGEGRVAGNRQGQDQRQQLCSRRDSWFDGSGGYGSDEEDYDQLFMEVIGGIREQDGVGQGPAQQYQWDRDACLDRQQDGLSSSMDLS